MRLPDLVKCGCAASSDLGTGIQIGWLIRSHKPPVWVIDVGCKHLLTAHGTLSNYPTGLCLNIGHAANRAVLIRVCVGAHHAFLNRTNDTTRYHRIGTNTVPRGEQNLRVRHCLLAFSGSVLSGNASRGRPQRRPIRCRAVRTLPQLTLRFS